MVEKSKIVLLMNHQSSRLFCQSSISQQLEEVILFLFLAHLSFLHLPLLLLLLLSSWPRALFSLSSSVLVY